MSTNKPALPVIRRLPRYYRYITELKNSGVTKISSSQLASIMGSTPSQVRQDFNCFGGFGQQGVGYSTEVLQQEIGKLIFPESNLRAVLVGTGNMGIPIANFVSKETEGIDLIGLFDNDNALVGNHLIGFEIQPISRMENFCKENSVDVIIVCTDRQTAEDIAPEIIKTGVKGIWNFSHFDFSLFDHSLIVENVHLRDNLMALSYRVTHNDEKDTLQQG